jgi:hypothetical protein
MNQCTSRSVDEKIKLDKKSTISGSIDACRLWNSLSAESKKEADMKIRHSWCRITNTKNSKTDNHISANVRHRIILDMYLLQESVEILKQESKTHGDAKSKKPTPNEKIFTWSGNIAKTISISCHNDKHGKRVMKLLEISDNIFKSRVL